MVSLVAIMLSNIPLLIAWLADLDVVDYAALAALWLLLPLGPIMMVGGVTLAFHIAIRSARALSHNPPWIVYSHWFVVALIISSIQVVAFFFLTGGRLLWRLVA